MIKFYAKRYIFLAISLFVLVSGICAIFLQGISLDIEFKGGSVLKYEYTEEINLEQTDKMITGMLNRAATCQTMEETFTGKKFLVVTLAGNEGLAAESQKLITDALQETFPTAGLALYETSIVEPLIGKRFLQNGITAIALAFVLIVLYVWIRFKRIGGLSAGIMALVALLHDCLVVFFVFVIFRMPINENFIAVVLTMVGFSVNDTIVIYDRIRENFALAKSKTPIEEVVDKSITQSLSRSINTNAAVFAAILIVCIFAQINGISSITSFALPMTFGVISGCYSTICIAGPWWVAWKKRGEKHRK